MQNPAAPGNEMASVLDPAPVSSVKAAIRMCLPLLKRAVGLSIVLNLLALAPAVFSLQIYDRVIYRSGMATLTALVIGMGLLLVIDLLLRRARSRMLREAAVQIDARISGSMMGHFLSLPLPTVESRSAAFWFGLFKDIEIIRSTWSGATAMIVLDLPFALLALGVIGFIALPVLPVALVGIGALCVIGWASSGELRGGKLEEVERARSRDDLLAEVCRARESIKSLCHDESVQADWRNAYVRWVKESFDRNGEFEGYHEMSVSISLTISILITVAGALAVINHWMTVGGLIAANMLAAKAIGPIVALSNHWRTFAMARDAQRRLEAVFDEQSERAASGLQLPRPKGRLTLVDVAYQYQDSPAPVLTNVNGSIDPNAMCAIVGDNGGGKSTLLKILRGLYAPAAGKVCLDDYDLAQFSRKELAHWIGYLPQYTHLFDGTILHNLRRGAPDVDDQAVLLACQRAGAHDFISRMPEGYASPVGEGGKRLSAGQRRRIGIAQALLHDPQILLFDEPTNDLDFSAESHLIATLRQLAQSRTIIVITHSIRLMAACNTMIHVSKGGELRSGSATELLRAIYGIGAPAAARPAAVAVAAVAAAVAAPANVAAVAPAVTAAPAAFTSATASAAETPLPAAATVAAVATAPIGTPAVSAIDPNGTPKSGRVARRKSPTAKEVHA